MNIQQASHGIRRLWLVQLSVTVICALVFWVTLSEQAAASALLGGVVGIIPNAYFALQLFKHQGARSAKRIVNSFYKGEAKKIALAIVLFTLVFLWVPIVPLAFFAAYLVVLMTHWFAPLIMVNNRK